MIWHVWSISAQRPACTGAVGGVGRVFVCISAISSSDPGAMSSRLTGMLRATRAAQSCWRVWRPDCPSTVSGDRPRLANSSLSFACWAWTPDGSSVPGATVSGVVGSGGSVVSGAGSGVVSGGARRAPVMSSMPLPGHTSIGSPALITFGSPMPFSSATASTERSGFPRLVTMALSESPGAMV